MAKFKTNDLITDGRNTLWVTALDDTHYTFTNQDGSTSRFSIDSIDAEYELWKPRRIWHEPTEEPLNNKRVVIVEKSYYGIHYDVGHYSKEEKVIICDIDRWKLNEVTHWAYMRDLINLTYDGNVQM